jgi:hypothetical protein
VGPTASRPPVLCLATAFGQARAKLVLVCCGRPLKLRGAALGRSSALRETARLRRPAKGRGAVESSRRRGCGLRPDASGVGADLISAPSLLRALAYAHCCSQLARLDQRPEAFSRRPLLGGVGLQPHLIASEARSETEGRRKAGDLGPPWARAEACRGF